MSQPSLNYRLSLIELIVLDVDGVLTDGRIMYHGNGDEIKAFNVLDGFGITMARHSKIKTAILTGRISSSVKRRALELKFDYYEAGHFNKTNALKGIINQAQMKQSQVLYMGDDILDLVCLPYVAVLAAPLNAHTRVKEHADWISTRPGGSGAVREVIDLILAAKGSLRECEDHFLKPAPELG